MPRIGAYASAARGRDASRLSFGRMERTRAPALGRRTFLEGVHYDDYDTVWDEWVAIDRVHLA